MKKMITHSKSSLFLMEMILSILILALTCTACVRIFAAAREQRQEARELNHIQELTTSVGETLEGWDGELSSFTQIFGEADSNSATEAISSDSSKRTPTDNSKILKSPYLLDYYYDTAWDSCDKNSAEYTMTIQLETSQSEKTAELNFYDSQNKNLYHLSITFPFDTRKDGQS